MNVDTIWSYPISRSSSDTSVYKKNVYLLCISLVCFVLFRVVFYNVSVKYAAYILIYTTIHLMQTCHFILSYFFYVYNNKYKCISAINQNATVYLFRCELGCELFLKLWRIFFSFFETEHHKMTANKQIQFKSI